MGKVGQGNGVSRGYHICRFKKKGHFTRRRGGGGGVYHILLVNYLCVNEEQH